MDQPISRRAFAAVTASAALAAALPAQTPQGGPVEASFVRDYPEPGFKPGWKRPQINRLMVQDFVIYAHLDLEIVKTLLDKEPGLLNATMDWGTGDWETALGGASHMGRRDIVGFLLERGARMDLFCATMLGKLDIVKGALTLEPKLLNAKGPHGMSLEVHAKAGGEASKPVLEYLQSLKVT